ncbi:MAG TPA: pseudouridine synthase [Phycisphaerales bacterium]|nr:pseudouridine synthase [Phycisphaerales bacterium]
MAEDGRKVRLQRVMADAGVAARRVCEELIEQGHVTVNGQVVRKLPVFVDPEQDEIMVEGRRLPKAQRRLYLMLNKPAGTIVSSADEPEMGRATVMDLIDHPSAPRLFPVGRLEYDTTGLLILTNDGDLANRLTHPRYRVPKTYQALVRGTVDEETKGAIQTKIRAVAERELGVKMQAPQIDIISRDEGRTLLELTMEEGPTRHLRDAFEFLGMPIKKLTRTAVGGLQLKGLAVGRWRELTREEISRLRKAGPGSARRGHTDQPVGTLPRRNRRPRPTNAPGGERKPRDAGGNMDREQMPRVRGTRKPQDARETRGGNATRGSRPSRDSRDTRNTRSSGNPRGRSGPPQGGPRKPGGRRPGPPRGGRR